MGQPFLSRTVSGITGAIICVGICAVPLFAGRSGRISLQTGGGGDPAGIGSADCRLHFWNRQRVSASAEDNLYDGITVSTDDRDRHSIDNLMHLKERKMTEGLYQWVENIAFYMVLMTAALHLIPGDGYRKYLKIFYRTFY